MKFQNTMLFTVTINSCRMCLEPEDIDTNSSFFFSLFDFYKEGIRFIDMYNKCIQSALEIREDDDGEINDLIYICNTCSNKLVELYEFQQATERVESLLRFLFSSLSGNDKLNDGAFYAINTADYDKQNCTCETQHQVETNYSTDVNSQQDDQVDQKIYSENTDSLNVLNNMNTYSTTNLIGYPIQLTLVEQSQSDGVSSTCSSEIIGSLSQSEISESLLHPIMRESSSKHETISACSKSINTIPCVMSSCFNQPDFTESLNQTEIMDSSNHSPSPNQAINMTLNQIDPLKISASNTESNSSENTRMHSDHVERASASRPAKIIILQPTNSGIIKYSPEITRTLSEVHIPVEAQSEEIESPIPTELVTVSKQSKTISPRTNGVVNIYKIPKKPNISSSLNHRASNGLSSRSEIAISSDKQSVVAFEQPDISKAVSSNSVTYSKLKNGQLSLQSTDTAALSLHKDKDSCTELNVKKTKIKRENEHKAGKPKKEKKIKKIKKTPARKTVNKNISTVKALDFDPIKGFFETEVDVHIKKKSSTNTKEPEPVDTSSEKSISSAMKKNMNLNKRLPILNLPKLSMEDLRRAPSKLGKRTQTMDLDDSDKISNKTKKCFLVDSRRRAESTSFKTPIDVVVNKKLDKKKSPNARGRPKKTVNCALCPKRFYDLEELKKHMEKHEKSRINCGNCSKDFSNENYLKLHNKVCKDKNESITELVDDPTKK